MFSPVYEIVSLNTFVSLKFILFSNIFFFINNMTGLYITAFVVADRVHRAYGDSPVRNANTRVYSAPAKHRRRDGQHEEASEYKHVESRIRMLVGSVYLSNAHK